MRIRGGIVFNDLIRYIESGGSVWGIRADALRVSTDVRQIKCSNAFCNIQIAVSKEEEDHWRGTACLRMDCDGSLKSFPATPDYYRNQYENGAIQRIFPTEHTALLDAKQRERIEEQFISGVKPWYPNLLSSTPTLESFSTGSLTCAAHLSAMSHSRISDTSYTAMR